MPIFSCLAQASWANGVSTLTADDGGVQFGVLAEAGGDVAHFLGANAGEGGGEKEQDGVFFAEIFAQFDIHQPGGVFGFEGEVRRF